jgi:hypothetical protein
VPAAGAPVHHSALQARHSSGRFGTKVAPEVRDQRSEIGESQTINVNVAPAPPALPMPATATPPVINVHVDATRAAKRSFKIKRKDGTLIEGEIEEAIDVRN